MNTEQTRKQLRVQLASLLSQGVRRQDLMADLIAAGRGSGTVGPRETADALEVTETWADLEQLVPFVVDKGPPGEL